MKTIRRGLMILISLAVMISFSVPAFAGSSATAKFPGHMTGSSGKVCYYAVGIDGGGPLYKYNTSTKKTKKIASGKWCWITASGKYLYLTKNNYRGSDGRDYYIYRMKKNGTSKKKLANGYDPVVKDKYIYYFATKKTNLDGTKVDGNVKGIYRMKKNGKGKKKLVSLGTNVNAQNLGVTKNGFICQVGDVWYTYNLKTRKLTSLGKYPTIRANLTIRDWQYWEGFSSLTQVKAGGIYYYASGGSVYTDKNGSSRCISSVDGLIVKIIVSGKQMMVVSSVQNGYSSDYKVYLMKTNGKGKKLVKKGAEVSGGWDY